MGGAGFPGGDHRKSNLPEEIRQDSGDERFPLAMAQFCDGPMGKHRCFLVRATTRGEESPTQKESGLQVTLITAQLSQRNIISLINCFIKSLLTSLFQREEKCPSLVKRGGGRFLGACLFNYETLNNFLLPRRGRI